MSLKSFNTYFVLITLTAMTLFYIYIAQLLQNNIQKQVHESVRSSAIELRQQLLSSFSTLQQRFVHYEEMSLLKLDTVQDAINSDDNSTDLVALALQINENVYDGHYEIYIIDANKTVVESTSKGDIGLNYSEYPYFSKELDLLQRGVIDLKISAPTFDEYALDIAQYYIKPLNDGRWVMIGFVLAFNDYMDYTVEDHQEVFPSLQALDLFILTYDNIQHINKKAHTTKDFKTASAEKEHYASMMMKNLKLSPSQDADVIETIASYFTHYTLVPLHHDDKTSSTVYSLVTSSFENPSDDFMLITKMEFDQQYFLRDYDELKNLLYLFVSFIFVLMLFAFIFVYKFVILRISSIVEKMHADDVIEIDGFMFSEFKFLLKRYNSFLTGWKNEVKRLNNITMQDELTKCANRRYFNKQIKAQIDLYKRYEQPFSMIMFDIDDFKMINDTYGHTKGDVVLVNMSKSLFKMLRASDILCRIGGEEFAIILPETDQEDALKVAEKIRLHVANEPYIEESMISISLGVGSFGQGDDFNSFYTKVDAALYRSKNSGKNCVSGIA